LVGQFRCGTDQFADGVVGAQQGPQFLLGPVGGLGAQHDTVAFELGLERAAVLRVLVLSSASLDAIGAAVGFVGWIFLAVMSVTPFAGLQETSTKKLGASRSYGQPKLMPVLSFISAVSVET